MGSDDGASGVSPASSPPSGSGTSPASATAAGQLKVKKSELRLYCDVLMQQVYKLKEAAEHPEDGIDVQVRR